MDFICALKFEYCNLLEDTIALIKQGKYTNAVMTDRILSDAGQEIHWLTGKKGKAPGYTAAGPYTPGLFEMKNEFSR